MRAALACIAAASVCSVAFFAPAPASAAVTTFVAKRPGLFVRIHVEGSRIVATSTMARVRCADGTTEIGSGFISEWKRFPIGARGRFKKSESDAYEGSGYYFWRLSGQMRANRVVGKYTAREERLGEEDEGWLPRCGTRSPRGLPMDFVARRVSGPPWRP